jgi:hypothetical protein
MPPLFSGFLVVANHQFLRPVNVAIGVGAILFVVVLGTLGLYLYRNYERLARRSLERAYADLHVHTTRASGDVLLVYHTYHGFFAWETETEHRVFLPLEEAQELLGRLLRFNLTWGILAHGGILVVPLAIGNYLRQNHALASQEMPVVFTRQQSVAAGRELLRRSRRRSWFHRIFGWIAALLAGLFAATAIVCLARREFEAGFGGLILAVLLAVLARDWLDLRPKARPPSR